MKAIDIFDLFVWIEEKTGHPLNPDEGLMFGASNRSVSSAAVCWVPSPENIRRAAALGCDLVIHHESLGYPYPFDHTMPLSAMTWPTNQQRLRAWCETGLTAVRLHGSVDELYIYDAFVETLGLSRVAYRGRDYACRVYNCEPTPYCDLINKVKRAVGMENVRVTPGPPDRVIHHVGLPWGGMGLFVNVDYMQSLISIFPGIDALICGETDNYGFRFAKEFGIDVIETSHEISENAGLRTFAKELGQAFESLTVHWIDEPCVWRMA